MSWVWGMGWNLSDLLDQLGVRPSCGLMGVESSCDIQGEPQSPACPPYRKSRTTPSRGLPFTWGLCTLKGSALFPHSLLCSLHPPLALSSDLWQPTWIPEGSHLHTCWRFCQFYSGQWVQEGYPASWPWWACRSAACFLISSCLPAGRGQTVSVQRSCCSIMNLKDSGQFPIPVRPGGVLALANILLSL